MKLSEFDYQLPISLIAQRPVYPRDQSKLLDINENKYTDRIFSELPDLLTEKDLIIINDTKVIPTRLIGKRNTTSINMTLHKKINNTSWFCFIKPAKKIKVGDTLLFRDLSAKVDDKFENGLSMGIQKKKEINDRFSMEAKWDGYYFHDGLTGESRFDMEDYVQLNWKNMQKVTH